MKYLCIVNTCWLLLLTIFCLLINSFSQTSLKEVNEIKKEVEIYLDQKPDTITININNFIENGKTKIN